LKRKLQILLADNSPLYTRAIVEVLAEHNILTSATVSNGVELLFLLESKIPDVVLLDLEMPVMNGEEALRRIRVRYPSCKVIILTSYKESGLAINLIESGAMGYVVKDEVGTCGDVLAEAIRAVYNGELFCTFCDLKHTKRYSSLEIDVMRGVYEEKITKEISAQMNIPTKKVNKVLQRLYKKTKTLSGKGLLKYVVQHRLFNLLK